MSKITDILVKRTKKGQHKGMIDSIAEEAYRIYLAREGGLKKLPIEEELDRDAMEDIVKRLALWFEENAPDEVAKIREEIGVSDSSESEEGLFPWENTPDPKPLYNDPVIGIK